MGLDTGRKTSLPSVSLQFLPRASKGLSKVDLSKEGSWLVNWPREGAEDHAALRESEGGLT